MMRDQLIATRQTLVSGLPVSGEIPARLTVAADRAPQARLHGLRRRRRAPAVGFDCNLCPRPDPPVQPAPRTDRGSAPLAGQLPQAEGGARRDLRAQPLAVALR